MPSLCERAPKIDQVLYGIGVDRDQPETAVLRVGSTTCAVSRCSRLDAAPWSTFNASSQAWRRDAIQRLMCEMKSLTQNCTAIA